jgi:hypothetical protein
MTKTSSKKTSMKKTAKKLVRTTLTTYVPVSDNIYHDGTSYRVRVVKNGNKISKNFSSKRKAVQFRNELLGK